MNHRKPRDILSSLDSRELAEVLHKILIRHPELLYQVAEEVMSSKRKVKKTR